MRRHFKKKILFGPKWRRRKEKRIYILISLIRS